VRRNTAAAAEARMKSEDARGLQNTEFRRMQERQAKIDKAQEEYERKGGDAALGSGLKVNIIMIKVTNEEEWRKRNNDWHRF